MSLLQTEGSRQGVGTRGVAKPASEDAARADAPLSELNDGTAFKCSATTMRLAENDLARSGLSLERVSADGMFPTDDASAVHPDFAAARAIILPYYDALGRPLTYDRGGRATPFCRARYLMPQGFPAPRGRKYDQPKASGTPPYFPRAFDWQSIEHGAIDLCVLVEGEKKAVALCRASIPAIAIGGVFSFSETGAPLHSALAAIVEECSDIYVVFDSDLSDKPQIQVAEWRLAGQLALHGVRVHLVRLPAGPNGQKVGADDYLCDHGPASLMELIVRTPALGDTAAADDSAVTVADLLSREVAPVEELIPAWLEKGIPTFLCGPGGTHKSRLALQWGLSLNSGAAVWGMGAKLVGL